IDDHGRDTHPAPGGYESILEQNGSGPGGGPKGDNTFGGAGASYCGVGGKGSSVSGTGSTPASAKAAYGPPELVPLHGGSSGGGLAVGADGTADSTPAAGGGGAAPGGLGGAGTSIDGSDAPAASGNNVAGGGGGGAGRIRINTKSGAADITASTISPAATTL